MGFCSCFLITNISIIFKFPTIEKWSSFGSVKLPYSPATVELAGTVVFAYH